MEFARRGHPSTASADEDVDDGRHFPDPAPPHGDAMLVIRDALLSQLYKDRLRQEIIEAELAKIERDMALRAASHHGIATADAEQAKPVPVAFKEESTLHRGGAVGPEHYADVDAVHDLTKKDGVHGGVELKSQKPATEDHVVGCSRICCTGKASGQENAEFDEPKLQESNETVLTKKTSPSPVKWSCAICQVKATSEGNLNHHFAGQKHRTKVASLVSRKNANGLKAKATAEKPRPTWVCRFCQSNCTSKSDLETHLKGKRHQAKIQALLEECKNMARNSVSLEADLPPNIVPQDEDKPASTWNCSLCQAKCTCLSHLENHLRGKRHQLNFLVLQVEAMLYLSEWGCSICESKCNSGSQFEDHCRSRKHQQKIQALERECENVKLSGLNTSKKLPSDDSNSKGGSSEEMEIQRTLYFCKLCNLHCNSKNTLAEHIRGKKHTAKVEKRMLLSFCEVCNLQCNSEKMLAHHRTGKTHLAKLHGC